MKTLSPGHTIYCGKLQARLAVHHKLDLLLWAALRRYLGSHDGDSRYWAQHCHPFLHLLREHHRLTQLTSRPLAHYSRHVEKLVLRAPRQLPSVKQAVTFLALIEIWYWREYA